MKELWEQLLKFLNSLPQQLGIAALLLAVASIAVKLLGFEVWWHKPLVAVVLTMMLWTAAVVLMRRSIPRTTRGLILAAGRSRRWRQSTRSVGHRDKINKILEKRGSNLRLPDPGEQPLHKSCAEIARVPLLVWNILGFAFNGISKIRVAVSGTNQPDSPEDEQHERLAQEQISHYVDDLGRVGSCPDVNKLSVMREQELLGTIIQAIQQMSFDPDDELVVSYSDIVWDGSMLRKLLSYDRPADVIFLVDTNWQTNYPADRVWHDELCAELVFGDSPTSSEIRAIGELIHCYSSIPNWEDDPNRTAPFRKLLAESVIGEVVGLFRITPRGRKLMRSLYAAHLRDGCVPLPNLNDLFPASSVPLSPILSTPPQSALFGCFLSSMMKAGAEIVPIAISARENWREIDHWGDLVLANHALNPRAQ